MKSSVSQAQIKTKEGQAPTVFQPSNALKLLILNQSDQLRPNADLETVKKLYANLKEDLNNAQISAEAGLSHLKDLFPDRGNSNQHETTLESTFAAINTPAFQQEMKGFANDYKAVGKDLFPDLEKFESGVLDYINSSSNLKILYEFYDKIDSLGVRIQNMQQFFNNRISGTRCVVPPEHIKALNSYKNEVELLRLSAIQLSLPSSFLSSSDSTTSKNQKNKATKSSSNDRLISNTACCMYLLNQKETFDAYKSDISALSPSLEALKQKFESKKSERDNFINEEELETLVSSLQESYDTLLNDVAAIEKEAETIQASDVDKTFFISIPSQYSLDTPFKEAESAVNNLKSYQERLRSAKFSQSFQALMDKIIECKTEVDKAEQRLDDKFEQAKEQLTYCHTLLIRLPASIDQTKTELSDTIENLQKIVNDIKRQSQILMEQVNATPKPKQVISSKKNKRNSKQEKKHPQTRKIDDSKPQKKLRQTEDPLAKGQNKAERRSKDANEAQEELRSQNIESNETKIHDPNNEEIIKTLQEELKQTKSLLATEQKKAECLQKAADEAQEELNLQKTELNKTLEQNKLLELKLQKLNENLAVKRNKVKQLPKTKKELKDKQNELAQPQQENEELKKQLQKSNSIIEKLQKEKTELTKNNEELRQSNQELQRQTKRQEDTLQTLIENQNVIEQQMEKLKKQLNHPKGTSGRQQHLAKKNDNAVDGDQL